MQIALQTWRDALKNIQNELFETFACHKNGSRLLKLHTQRIDALLKEIWLSTKLEPSLTLIAVGGYGRGELFPYSDIDLLILLPEQITPEVSTSLESLISLFWDIGLNVGHSVRTVHACLEEAEQDVSTLTNLLEARLLIGNRNLFHQLQIMIASTLDAKDFLTLKIKEQKQRHAKFNETAYNLEPNIKESPGGLRDLHMILWLAKSQQLGSDWITLEKQGIICPKEKRLIQRHQSNLTQLRIRLHFLAKRREDRLLFDYQNELAAQFGYQNEKKHRASEQLMHSFYCSAKFINFINELLVKIFIEKTSPHPEIIELNTRFEARDGWLELKNPHQSMQQIQTQPTLLLESFLQLQHHATLKGVGAYLMRAIYGNRLLIDAKFRKNSHHKRLFLDIFQQSHGVHHSLRRMNRYGVLGRYVLAFGKIVGQMQHDLFHVYTVDEHTLKVLSNLRRFAKSELKHEFPLCSQLLTDFDTPYLLYLAALFHDIAKGRGGDHSELGEIEALQFCQQHHLPDEDAKFVAWLVKHHLIMSGTAQKEDLSDPAVIEKFSRTVGNERKLIGLYLLTVADIRGTSPAIWNAWKAKLLENLYYASKKALANGLVDTHTEIIARKTQARSKLDIYNLPTNAYDQLWAFFGEQYFLRYESDEIAWHTRLLTPHLNSLRPIVRARLSPHGDGIQTMIYMPDKNDVFAHICHFFDSIHYNILQAKIYTTAHAYALDTFIIEDQSGKAVSYTGLLKHIENELSNALASNTRPQAPISGRINRQVKHMPIATKISLASANAKNLHLLEITTNDRPGLLDTIAQQFLQHGISLHNAKINTLGNRVEDHFLISAQHNQMLSDYQLEALKSAVEQILQ